MVRNTAIVLLSLGVALNVLSCNMSQSAPITAGGATVPPSSSAPSKKLIEFGWDNPRSDFVRQNIVSMQQKPFAGITMLFNVGTNIFNKTPYLEGEFSNDRDNLQDTNFGTLTDNFFRMDTRHETGWNWQNDNDWAAALENVRQTTRTAKVGNFKGFFFDTEAYGPNPWNYDPAKYNTKSYAEISSIVRARGRDFIRVVHEELPGAKIITLWAQSVISRQIGWSGAVTSSSWPLYIPFMEGWMDGAQGETFIDGNENAYFNLLEEDYTVERNDFNDAIRLFSAENQTKRATDRLCQFPFD